MEILCSGQQLEKKVELSYNKGDQKMQNVQLKFQKVERVKTSK